MAHSFADLILQQDSVQDLTCGQMIRMMSTGFIELEEFKKYSERRFNKQRTRKGSCSSMDLASTEAESEAVMPIGSATSEEFEEPPSPEAERGNTRSAPPSAPAPILDVQRTDSSQLLPNRVRE